MSTSSAPAIAETISGSEAAGSASDSWSARLCSRLIWRLAMESASTPDIRATRSLRCTSTGDTSATTAPSRSTTIRSASVKTCSRSCVASSTLAPASRASRRIDSTSAVSATPSEAVGSSITSRRGGVSSARATATSCRWPRDRTRSGTSRRRSRAPTRRSSAAACSRRADSGTTQRPGRPRKMLATASRSSQSPCSCHTVSTPARRTCPGRAGMGRPANITSPASASSTPAMAPIRVDLPAPLPPATATISPWPTWRLTSRSTVSGPKLLVSPLTSSRAAWPRGSADRLHQLTSVSVMPHGPAPRPRRRVRPCS